MSLVKPNVPEGFATIRTRGLTRSTSRAEQMAPSRRSSSSAMKPSSSGPLYENNGNSLAYKSTSATLICVPPPVPPRTTSELSSAKNDQKEADDKENSNNPYRNDDDVFCTSTLTYETFKPLKSPTLKEEDTSDYISLMQSSECIDRLNYDFELPPLKSPQYITELKLIQSKAIESGNLFTRPESPPYGKIRNSYRSSTPESVDNCSSGSSTYSNPINSGKSTSLSGFLGPDESSKPLLNSKSTTIQYRKSYSSSRSEIIYEEPKKFVAMGSQSSDTDSGYDGGPGSYPKIHKSAELLNVLDSGRPSLTRGYSTMGHPRGVGAVSSGGYPPKTAVGESKSTSSLNEAHLASSAKPEQQLLNQKVGSQTTLRSKPIIPWYELALRKDHRQSCPPLQSNAVTAFEQNLVNVSQKLQKMTTSTDEKDSEILEMKQTIELLRQQSAGIAATQLLALTSSHGTTASGTAQSQSAQPPTNGEMKRHHSTDSMYSVSSTSTSCSNQDKLTKKKSGFRHSLQRAFSRSQKGPKASRPVSQSSNPDPDFMLMNYPSHEDVCISPQPYVPPLSPTKISPPNSASPIQNGEQQITFDRDGNPVVTHLVKQLREKDLVLTDIRLEALTTASQVESLKETVMKMRQEMMSLKHNNDRLQQIVTRRSITGSELSLGSTSPTSSVGESRRYSAAVDYINHGRPMLDLPLDFDEGEEDNIPPAPAPEPPPEPLSPAFIADMSPTVERPMIPDSEIISIANESMVDHIDGKKIAIAVYLGQMDQFLKYLDEMNENGHQENGKIRQNEFTIAFTYVSGKTSWQSLDYIIHRSFKDFLERVDPSGNLGLSTDSIASYHVGEAKRAYDVRLPELLPYGYIIGNVDTLYICLRGVSNIALDNLIIKNMVLRYKSSAVVDPKRMAARGSMESIAN
ncbi:protein sickie-like [Aedes aegypti]|uniref:Neuron navigator 1-like ubiquitin-like domain-containing protein n=1 Tax=Aedes aegypti TaxID=7159 RepID=A0A6I8U0I3_AEDAE|nr:protein sickie-like [Aedes aegypti]